MAFEYGFYNSINGDRKYNALDFGKIFDGVITDGVFAAIGDKLFTTPGTRSMEVLVGTGKAWFDHTWNLNTSPISFIISAAHPVLTRYDAIVLEVNESQDARGRVNEIKVVSGVPSSNAVKPNLINTEHIHQHPLAYIKINPEATTLVAADIEITVGRTGCPFVTSILQQTDITTLFANWGSQFDAWFNNLKAQLTDNVVTNLQNQIDNCLKVKDIATQAEINAGTAGKVVTAPFFMKEVKLAYETRRLVAITRSFTFTVPNNAKNNSFYVLVQGGGGGAGGGGGGGGSGFTVTKQQTLTPGSKIACTIGGGGKQATSANAAGARGGTTKFGTLITSSGGYGGGPDDQLISVGPGGNRSIAGAGGAGGAGGGGSGANPSGSGHTVVGGPGGTGDMLGGGGGGGSGYAGVGETVAFKYGGAGGKCNASGYGGGGGSGSNNSGEATAGGAGSSRGGAGGRGSGTGSSGIINSTNGANAPVHNIGYGNDLYFFGSIFQPCATLFGVGGESRNNSEGNKYYTGGGGGGGYMGNGGDGGSWADSRGVGSGGGGGGGYFGEGGSAVINDYDPTIGDPYSYSGGGGGGGYNGRGGAGIGRNPRASAQVRDASIASIGYGAGGNMYGGGGGGVDIGDGTMAIGGDGTSGIILIAWEEIKK